MQITRARFRRYILISLPAKSTAARARFAEGWPLNEPIDNDWKLFELDNRALASNISFFSLSLSLSVFLFAEPRGNDVYIKRPDVSTSGHMRELPRTI